MNSLVFIIPSNMKNQGEVFRVLESVDVSQNIFVYFINQSSNNIGVNELYEVNQCHLIEIKTGKIIPLSQSRNLALNEVVNATFDERTLVMFIDDDAWFPRETIDFLLSCDIKGILIKTIDPQKNISYKKSYNKSKLVTGYHICCDVVSICMVLPLEIIKRTNQRFNENLGLGNRISQGEETLFIYELHKKGLEIHNDNHLIYHPYKKTFNEKNFYSLSYFFSVSLKKISILFLIPEIKLLVKYSLLLAASIIDSRYLKLFIAVWKGFADGKRDVWHVIER